MGKAIVVTPVCSAERYLPVCPDSVPGPSLREIQGIAIGSFSADHPWREER